MLLGAQILYNDDRSDLVREWAARLALRHRVLVCGRLGSAREATTVCERAIGVGCLHGALVEALNRGGMRAII